MKAVIDTNVVVSWLISPAGTPARTFNLLYERAFQPVVSREILAEYRRALLYERVARRHRFTPNEIDHRLEELRELAVIVEPQTRLHVIPDDPDDNKFLECAVEGEADYIVSGDRHLLKLGRYQGIEILPPAVFVMAVAGRRM
ncbi:MAG: putative toxin-antitoxin system toxin component, PIN family [Chloroflexi bacterium]|nr:putative toxin-antitoxin system toxin component, PIN family [Chloroflexota bacterium]